MEADHNQTVPAATSALLRWTSASSHKLRHSLWSEFLNGQSPPPFNLQNSAKVEICHFGHC